METMAKTSRCNAKTRFCINIHLKRNSANDVLLLEIVAGGTEFAAGPNNEDAFATLIDGDQWMIFRNTETGVLHWDFVRLYSPMPISPRD
jgi:hypothetical protein